MKNEKMQGVVKNQYITPEIDIIELKTDTAILEYSNAGGDGDVLPPVNL